MDKDWVIGFGFGLGAVAVLAYIWGKFARMECGWNDEDYDSWNDER
jgi:hypothetical protein